MKFMLDKVGHQIRKVGKGRNKQNPTAVEYSLSQYEKNLAKIEKEKKKLMKRIGKQGRDDDNNDDNNELLIIEEVRSSIPLVDENDNSDDTPKETTESILDPLSWMFSLTSQHEEDESKHEDEIEDDHREVESEEHNDYQADQGREQCPEHKKEEFNDRAHKRRWRKHTEKKRSKASGGNKAPTSQNFLVESQEDTTEIQLLPRSQSWNRDARSESSLRISAVKSSKAIVSGAKKVTTMPVRIAQTSSKLLVSNARRASKSTSRMAARSTKAITNGAQRSSRAFSNSIGKTSNTSKELSKSIKRMVQANQMKAASSLLASVHANLQKSDEFITPGMMLGSVQTLIRNSDKNIGKNRRLACRERRRKYRQKIHSKKKKNKRDEQVQCKGVCDGKIISVDIPLAQCESIDGTVLSAVIDVYQSDYDVETEIENTHHTESKDDSDADWDDSTKGSVTSYSTSDFSTDDELFSINDVIEIDGITLCEDSTDGEITSIQSESDYGSSESDYGNSDDGYTSGGNDIIQSPRWHNDDVDDDDVTCILNEKDQAVLDEIEEDLKRLECMHENEKEWWLYRAFLSED